MSATGKEFYLAHPERLIARLEALGAALSAPRVHEINLRFDTPSGELTRTGRLLRLRPLSPTALSDHAFKLKPGLGTRRCNEKSRQGYAPNRHCATTKIQKRKMP